jgi:formamidopyrimidine-DNA glycosylase
MAIDSARLARHPLFRDLGVEPLSEEFSGTRLRALGAGRRGPVKSFLMNGRLVVGVGNIYASESLYRAGIHPNRSVARVSLERWDRLAAAVRAVLAGAIAEGGTTLNDFANGLGEEGEFQGSLEAYGRESEPCGRCGEPIRRFLQGGRSTYYCPGCQR